MNSENLEFLFDLFTVIKLNGTVKKTAGVQKSFVSAQANLL